MRKSAFKEPRIILVFNRARLLIGISRSLYATADMTMGNIQAISFCCQGKYIYTGGFYYRYLHPDVLLELDDLGELRLEEYDRLCGETRQYRPIKDLKRRAKTILRQRLERRRKMRAKNKE